jgi:type I restriction enzyme R subunit
MSLNESIVEDAALEWFGEQCRVAPTLTPALSHGEREEDGEVVLVGCLREAIRRLNPAIPEEARAVVADFSTDQTERRQNP